MGVGATYAVIFALTPVVKTVMAKISLALRARWLNNLFFIYNYYELIALL